jgi:hypothetical protein
MARTTTVAILTAETGLIHYFPMVDRQEEYMLAKRLPGESPGAASRLG